MTVVFVRDLPAARQSVVGRPRVERRCDQSRLLFSGTPNFLRKNSIGQNLVIPN